MSSDDRNKNLDPTKKEINETGEKSGTAGAYYFEPLVEHNFTDVERIYSNNNSWLILGKDRNGSPVSGYSGMGETQASSIDIVVGKKGNASKQVLEHDTAADPDFIDDAARVYLTQKGDVDTYFGITTGTENNLISEKKSAVGIKADHVRLFGREHIKIVTGQSENFRAKEDKNSLAETIGKVGRIDFIAGNYNDSVSNPSKLQPLVKGENLVEFQKEIIETLEEIIGHITTNSKEVAALWSALGSAVAPATAISAVPPALTAFQTSCEAKSMYINSVLVISQKGITQNLNALRSNYLEVVDGSQYINSEHVFTT